MYVHYGMNDVLFAYFVCKKLSTCFTYCRSM